MSISIVALFSTRFGSKLYIHIELCNSFLHENNNWNWDCWLHKIISHNYLGTHEANDKILCIDAIFSVEIAQFFSKNHTRSPVCYKNYVPKHNIEMPQIGWQIDGYRFRATLGAILMSLCSSYRYFCICSMDLNIAMLHNIGLQVLIRSHKSTCLIGSQWHALLNLQPK